ncbi:MAG: L,D-transpeptidase [Polyangiaceae bacterium]
MRQGIGMGRRLLMGLLAIATSAACQRGGDVTTSSAAPSVASVSALPAAEAAPAPTFGKNSIAASMSTDKPLLGVTSFVAIVYKEPRDTSKRLGYLRVGTKVPRSDSPVSTRGCPGGWYQIEPHGYVCAGKDATIDLEDPILKAASRRPNLTGALPYRYGFVRAVLPLYLKIPTADEQLKAEFKLKEHLDWYAANHADIDKTKLGAWDVPLDDRGVPLRGKQIGDLGQQKTSAELGLGQLFGGESENDAPPFWLESGKRTIRNISDFDVPDFAVFADRARRFSGLAFVGSFAMGDDYFNRRFAITTDLRLAPTTKLKPDSGSPWHGVEIEGEADLPFAFVREQGASRFQVDGSSASAGTELEWRSKVKLSGKQKRVAGERYLALEDGGFVRASDVGVIIAPHTWPKAAEDGEKWIEVSLSQQTLTMWEGKRPIYATLVSTGREEFPTITGEFRIRNKHITATMDSNESSDVGGAPKVKRSSSSSSSSDGDDDAPKAAASKAAAPKAAAPKAAAKGAPAAPAKPQKTASAKGGDPKKKPAAPGKPAIIPRKGDGEYGVTKRRGEGTYQLRDVPYIQYFASGYALHAAYWHDVFGKQRSHGCVNLSPIDAHRVFNWTEPAVPDGWHAVNTGSGKDDEFGEGTVVIVHE